MTNFTRSLLVLFTLLASSAFAATGARFTRSLTANESASLGLSRLNSDQVAVLDALVRRDIDYKPAAASPKPAERFSVRLTADELRNSGLASLTDAEREQVDRMIQQFEHPIPLATSSSSLGSGRPANLSLLTENKLERAPEIHGSMSLLYGVGSGGYSERGGAIELSYEDPKGFAIGVGYSEVHSKGGYYDQYCRSGFPRWGEPRW